MRFPKILLIKILLFFTASMQAQFNEYHPEFDWYTLKGEHCEVHYHEGTERTARIILKIADEVHGPITSLYEYDPGVVHYVVKDIDDFANGASYYFDNKIEIWTSALDFDLRGTHNWLRNVITHEFTHMVQLQSSMKISRSVPAIYLQWLNYEDKRRPDILYGFPNVLVSYPIATINVPFWFAEGVAQYQRRELDYDNWDSHRDMILRSYALDNNFLTWDQMNVAASKTSLGFESVYNSGFALISYISQKYGEDKIAELAHTFGDMTVFTAGSAFEKVLGKSGEKVYVEWTQFLRENYKERIKDVEANLIEGEMIEREGIGNFHPILDEETGNIFYVSNKGFDYFSLSSLYKYDPDTKKSEFIADGVRSTFSRIPGTDKLIYSKLSEDNPESYKVHDLYLYDQSEDEETRLTFNLRADRPDVSPDGQKIVFLFQKDGTRNLAVVDIDGSSYRQITFFDNGEQIYTPRFSPNGKYIVFDFTVDSGRDIYRIDIDGTDMTPILDEKWDERNPVFGPDGKLYYASDETGIFNIYSMDPESADKNQITNVTGGAFMPAVNKAGELVYSGYTSNGYKIFHLDKIEETGLAENDLYPEVEKPPLGTPKPKGDITDFNIEKLKNYDDKEVPEMEPEKYSGSFTRLNVFPVIRYDNYNTTSNTLEKIKPGVYLYSMDMLMRYSLFAGASINSRMERDLFLNFEYKNKLPLLFDMGIKPDLSLEVYSISRKSDVDILIDELPAASTDVTYNLFEVDLAADHKIFTEDHNIELRYIFSEYTATLGSFIVPNLNQLYPTTDDTYLIANNIQLQYDHEMILPDRHADINPIGYEIMARYNYEMNRFNENGEYEVVDGMLKPVYDNFNFHRVELDAAVHLPFFLLEDHTISGRVRAGSILGPDKPDFFDFYLGGLIGMKSYPFYAISGNELLWTNLTYRFPLWTDIDKSLGHFYFDKMFMSVYADYGNAWTGEWPGIKSFKRGIGAELRISMESFYLFPTNLFFNVAYSLDKIKRKIDNETIEYGKELRFYGGILFGFDL